MTQRAIIRWSFAAIVNGIYPFTPCRDCEQANDLIGHLRKHLEETITKMERR